MGGSPFRPVPWVACAGHWCARPTSASWRRPVSGPSMSPHRHPEDLVEAREYRRGVRRLDAAGTGRRRHRSLRCRTSRSDGDAADPRRLRSDEEVLSGKAVPVTSPVKKEQAARQGTPLGLDADALAACVNCGLCLPHCPTFRVTGEESASPRGRINAMRGVEALVAAPEGAFVDYMEACVQCRACESVCPSSVPFGALMEDTRAALVTSGIDRGPWAKRALHRVGLWLLGHHRLLARRERAAVVDTADSRIPVPGGPADGSRSRGTPAGSGRNPTQWGVRCRTSGSSTAA